MLSNLKNKISNCQMCNIKDCNFKEGLIFVIKVSIISIISIILFVLPLKSLIIEKLLLSNPKAIIKAIEEMRKQESEKMQKQSLKALPEIYNKIISNASIPFIGNENSDKVVAIFYDYNCGYCKKQASEAIDMLKINKNLKIVLVDFPVLSRESFLAAQVGTYIFVNHKDSFFVYHNALIQKKQINENTIKEVLKSLNLPVSIFEKAQKDSLTMNILKTNHEMGAALSLQGTPALILKDKSKEVKLLPGYVPAEQILSLIG